MFAPGLPLWDMPGQATHMNKYDIGLGSEMRTERNNGLRSRVFLMPGLSGTILGIPGPESDIVELLIVGILPDQVVPANEYRQWFKCSEVSCCDRRPCT